LRPKFFLTDKKRAERVVQAARELNTVKDVFIIDGEAIGCTPFSKLLNDNGDGKFAYKTAARNYLQIYLYII